MLKLRKIAITGGLASGKSTVCNIFHDLGAYVIDADKLVHQLLQTNLGLQEKIKKKFGDVTTKGKIDRKKLADLVFADHERLVELENLIHPYVLQEIEKKQRLVEQDKSSTLFVVEIPLLFEIGAEKTFDYVITVISNPILAKKRMHDPKEYDRRMKRQMPQEEKAKRADFVIHNDESVKELTKQVTNILEKIRPMGENNPQ